MFRTIAFLAVSAILGTSPRALRKSHVDQTGTSLSAARVAHATPVPLCGDGVSDAVCPAGTKWYYVNDPECPNNPDSFEMYVEYWHTSNSAFDHDSYIGHSSYYCGATYKGQDIQGNGELADCWNDSPWGCGDLGTSYSPHP